MRGLDLENFWSVKLRKFSWEVWTLKIFQLSLDLVTIEDGTLKILVEVELWKFLVQVELKHFSNQNLEIFFNFENFFLNLNLLCNIIDFQRLS